MWKWHMSFFHSSILRNRYFHHHYFFLGCFRDIMWLVDGPGTVEHTGMLTGFMLTVHSGHSSWLKAVKPGAEFTYQEPYGNILLLNVAVGSDYDGVKHKHTPTRGKSKPRSSFCQIVIFFGQLICVVHFVTSFPVVPAHTVHSVPQGSWSGIYQTTEGQTDESKTLTFK